MQNTQTVSAQDALSYLQGQMAYIQQGIYEAEYSDVDVSGFVPIDTSADPFATEIVHYSGDRVGRIEQVDGQTTVLPKVEVVENEHVVKVTNFATSISMDMFEMEQSVRLGRNVQARKMNAARRISDENHYRLMRDGDSDLSWDGLVNSQLVTATDANTKGSGSNDAAKKLWVNKDLEAISDDINGAINAVYSDTDTIALANTILVPPSVLQYLASRQVPHTTMTVAEWLMRNNLYTQQTGNPLMIRGMIGLEDAGGSNTGRMIAYRNDPDVLVYHMVMPLTVDPMGNGPMETYFGYSLPLMTRSGGLEIRLPKQIRYLDGITS